MHLALTELWELKTDISELPYNTTNVTKILYLLHTQSVSLARQKLMSLPVLAKLRKYAGLKRNDAINRGEAQVLAKQTRRENGTHQLFVRPRHPYLRGVFIKSRDWSSHRLRRALVYDDWLTQCMFIVLWP